MWTLVRTLRSVASVEGLHCLHSTPQKGSCLKKVLIRYGKINCLDQYPEIRAYKMKKNK